jgi:putative CocE/NonD family hydrolase
MLSALALAMLLAGQSTTPVTPDMVQQGSDIPKAWNPPKDQWDYVRREVMIPMRDGVKLHTVIVIPKNAKHFPMLFERGPYNAAFDIKDSEPHLRDAVWGALREWVDDGYIFVSQDVRGKYASEGNYVMTRPPRGPLNPSSTDDTTDAYDTIAWLVKNVPESNGKVGMIGSSYDGWTVAMALLGPHPALKVAAPESPMVDGWRGDDWFHNGAFRQGNLDYFTEQSTVAGSADPVPRLGYDDYQTYLDGGAAGVYANAHGFQQLPWWNRLSAHPAYDAFWQLQAIDKLAVAHPSHVPTMWLQGLWDQEDIYGAVHTFEALDKAGYQDNNHLVMGPWFHSQINREGRELGPLLWPGDTTADFRKNVMIPFFDQYLKDEKPAHPLPRAMVYDPAEKHWDAFASWPAVRQLTPIYLAAEHGLSFQQPDAGEDSYVSDPAKPVPFLPQPVRFSDHAQWSSWLVQDQRFANTRPDVISFETAPLNHAVRVQGDPVADIFAKITGSDVDFVVKIIDVYPPSVPEQPAMGGYELPISMDIFRGRYRKDLAVPSAVPSNEVQEYKFGLPSVNYVFQPGHRIMVQIQSSWFPVYDRNPQTYVPNIFFAQPQDYKAETISVLQGSGGNSAVLLPVSGTP